jgi:sugar lactone lactonase YvrE
MSTTKTTTLVKDLHFAESPTLGPDGRVYVSDFYAHEVLAVDLATGATESVATVPAQPSGLGWTPDGALLIVSMNDRKLMRLDPDGTLSEHADLGAVAKGSSNDMYVDEQGRAWVGDFGFDFYDLLRREPDADPLFGPGADPERASLAYVDLDGRVSKAAGDLRFPNGMARLSDGRLVVAETVGGCLTSFRVEDDGSLREATLYADLSSAGPGGATVLPDGICVDAEDGIWVSDPTGGGAVRIGPDGEPTDYVATSQACFATGIVGHTLIACTAVSSNPNEAGTRRTGRLEVATVAVPSRP